MRQVLRGARRNLGQMVFERRYGVRTDGRTDQRNSASQPATGCITFRLTGSRCVAALSRREVSGDDVFIDLGSGKGRMVLAAAARYPFKRVIGVELAEQLHEVARANVASSRWRLRCKDIVLVCSDVLDYEIPDDVTVVFLNNPFRGETFAGVIKNLIASADKNPRRIKVIYSNPIEEPALLGTGRLYDSGSEHVDPADAAEVCVWLDDYVLPGPAFVGLPISMRPDALPWSDGEPTRVNTTSATRAAVTVESQRTGHDRRVSGVTNGSADLLFHAAHGSRNRAMTSCGQLRAVLDQQRCAYGNVENVESTATPGSGSRNSSNGNKATIRLSR